ncbi:hypothetical protein CRENBAI_023144 [Crenichthys baileyi]|uniref:Uncharacterized protein n=1 Tax=Crenichthys baileyi TaxID=28760 RepID=A0AAV9SP45_9TELE
MAGRTFSWRALFRGQPCGGSYEEALEVATENNKEAPENSVDTGEILDGAQEALDLDPLFRKLRNKRRRQAPHEPLFWLGLKMSSPGIRTLVVEWRPEETRKTEGAWEHDGRDGVEEGRSSAGAQTPAEDVEAENGMSLNDHRKVRIRDVFPPKECAKAKTELKEIKWKERRVGRKVDDVSLTSEEGEGCESD